MSRPVLRGALAALVAALAAALLCSAAAPAASIPDRTLRVSATPDGGDANGPSTSPAVSTDGRTIAYSTAATDLGPADPNGAIADVLAVDLVTGVRRLVSEGGDAPSVTPAISGDGQYVAFATLATNLVPGDTNGVADVVVRDGRRPPALVSVGLGGAPANGASYQPDISANGQYVVFTSAASNLVDEDTNGKPDVFVRDLAAGRTIMVSRSSDGGASNGRSSLPAISGNGRFVAFESGATNLVEATDDNGVADVFVHDLRRTVTEMVSVSSAGRQQNRSVKPPFLVAPDITRDGRYVVFESDATTLTRNDRNRRTDVFLRDRTTDRTRLISANNENFQGNNDSFGPVIAPGGDYVAFTSFASNLVERRNDGPREDVFVRDLEEGTTTVATTTNSGAPRLGELGGQNLQRPAIANGGFLVVFGTTVPNLVDGDRNGQSDIFLRLLTPPDTRLVRGPRRGRRTLRVAADDPRATGFICSLDRRDPFLCGPNIDLGRRIGRVLSVQAVGPGMLADPDGITVRVSNDRRRPSARIRRPSGRSVRVLRGTASDRGGAGVARVEVAALYFSRTGKCVSVTGGRVRAGSCNARRWSVARGRRSWSLRLPQSIRGPIAVLARSTDLAGNRSRTVVLRFVL